MQVLYLGVFCRKAEESELIANSKIGIQGAVISFQWNLIEGLNANTEIPISVINYLPVGTYPKYFKKILLKTVKWGNENNSVDQTLGCINIAGIKQLMRVYNARFWIEKWIKRTSDFNKCIIIYDLSLPYLIAVKWIKKKYPNVVTCSVVADLPNEFGYNKNEKGTMNFLRKILGKIQLHEIQKIDCYALLTDQMKYPLNIRNDSYVVVEGIASSDMIYREMQESEKKVILYTGVLTKIYGVDILLNAFMGIAYGNYELWLCGSGDYQNQICKYAQRDNRIKFFGYCTKKAIYEFQNCATVLINPRKNDADYIKYSFPSKIMEYLASGRPVIAHKLDGIPSEYYNYIQPVDGDSTEDLRKKIVQVCELPFEERKRIGCEGKEFVIQHKNSKAQCQKIIDLIKKTSDTKYNYV